MHHDVEKAFLILVFVAVALYPIFSYVLKGDDRTDKTLESQAAAGNESISCCTQDLGCTLMAGVLGRIRSLLLRFGLKIRSYSQATLARIGL